MGRMEYALMKWDILVIDSFKISTYAIKPMQYYPPSYFNNKLVQAIMVWDIGIK